MTDLPAFAELAAVDQGLCVFTTLRADAAVKCRFRDDRHNDASRKCDLVSWVTRAWVTPA